MNFYYHPDPTSNQVLSPEESAHAVKVLRVHVGDHIDIIDGLGTRFSAKITDANHRKCGFEIVSQSFAEKKRYAIHIAIAPTKSMDRLEWFVEKACEIGVDKISILSTQRTERKKVNIGRIEKKAISAMKQSKNYWKCEIEETTKLSAFLSKDLGKSDKFVAFVETEKEILLQHQINKGTDTIILIGPEGDFTHDEINSAKAKGFVPISLGAHVLRTETAGVIAAHTVHLMNS